MPFRDAPAPETPIVVCTDDALRLQRVITSAVGTRQEDAADQLEQELSRARVLPGVLVPPDVVTMGARVVFEDETSRVHREVTLVYPEDANASEGRISVLAPIGAALLGLRVDQRIEWSLPQGSTIVRVVRVEQPRR